MKFMCRNFEHVGMKMYAAGYFETCRRVYQTSRRHTLEGLSAEQHRRCFIPQVKLLIKLLLLNLVGYLYYFIKYQIS